MKFCNLDLERLINEVESPPTVPNHISTTVPNHISTTVPNHIRTTEQLREWMLSAYTDDIEE